MLKNKHPDRLDRETPKILRIMSLTQKYFNWITHQRLIYSIETGVNNLSQIARENTPYLCVK